MTKVSNFILKTKNKNTKILNRKKKLNISNTQWKAQNELRL